MNARRRVRSSVRAVVRAPPSSALPPPKTAATASGTWRALLVLLVLAVGPYLRTLSFDFVFLDDVPMVVDGAWFFRDWGNIPRVFFGDVWHFVGGESSLYRPMLLLPRFLAADLFGTSPGPYHLLTLLLHGATVAALFAVLRTLVEDERHAMGWTALFAIHPAHAPVVAWIEGYNNSMLALFLLATAFAALRVVETGSRRWVVASGGALFLALLTKENAVSAPLLALGLCALYARRRGFALRGRPGLRAMGVAWGVALVLWALLRWHAIPSTPELEPSYVAASVVRNHAGVLLYWGKLFFPWNLTPLPILRDSSFVPGAVAVALYAIVMARGTRDDRYVLGFGVLWFLALISASMLVARLTSPVGAIFREDRLYQASLGPLIALALVSRSWRLGAWAPAARVAVGAWVVVALVMAQVSASRYADGRTFYAAAVEGSPHLAFAHTHLADMLLRSGDHAGARREYEEALALNPRLPTLHNNYAVLLEHDGDYARADEHYSQEIAVNPAFAKVYYNRGRLQAMRGEYAGAAVSFEAFLARHPADDDLTFMSRLGLVESYRRLQRHEDVLRVERELQARGSNLLPHTGAEPLGQART